MHEDACSGRDGTPLISQRSGTVASKQYRLNTGGLFDRKGEGSEIALLSKADGKRISITGAFPEAQVDGCFQKVDSSKNGAILNLFFFKLTAPKPCRRVLEGAAG